MIIGIGNDLLDIRRVEKLIDQYGQKFLSRLFTAQEQQMAQGRQQLTAFYAKRIAAKEACAKALGTGIAQGVSWQDMNVVNFESGKPHLQLSGQSLIILQNLLPYNHQEKIHVTLSDDFPWVQAFVLIEALPKKL